MCGPPTRGYPGRGGAVWSRDVGLLGMRSERERRAPGISGRWRRIGITDQSHTNSVGVDAKWRSQPLSLSEALRWRGRRADDAILALHSIPERRSDQYRSLRINYVDSGGNAFFDFSGFRIHVKIRLPRSALRSVDAVSWVCECWP